jgi:hypothetical protein
MHAFDEERSALSGPRPARRRARGAMALGGLISFLTAEPQYLGTSSRQSEKLNIKI